MEDSVFQAKYYALTCVTRNIVKMIESLLAAEPTDEQKWKFFNARLWEVCDGAYFDNKEQFVAERDAFAEELETRLFGEKEIVRSIPDNEIWYTSVLNTEVEPNTYEVNVCQYSSGPYPASNAYDETAASVASYFGGSNDGGKGIWTFNSNAIIGSMVFWTDAYTTDNLKALGLPAGISSIGGDAFYKNSGLTDVYFDGTIEEWEAVEKADRWNRELSFNVVHCLDGDAPVESILDE